MANVITIDLYELLEKKLGKDEAKEVVKAIELSVKSIEKKAEEVALQKKLEIKDELTKELATKADIARLDGEIALLRQEIKTEVLRIDRKFTVMFVILFFTVVFLNQNALEFIVRVLGIVK